jgi:glycosyltransferase involved in cell wall biosynthesis
MLVCSVLIPSFRRPDKLARCLRSLAVQTQPPGRVIVVWQADDAETRIAAEALRSSLPFELIVLHNAEAGVVPAENAALDVTKGEILLLIDDDAVAPPDWVARHLAHYADSSVGAVGGPADNYFPDGTPFPRRAVEPVGRLSWYGKLHGNMYDHVPAWRDRPAREVNHLVGYNLSLRRAAFSRFETGLKRYWQMFELEACLQVLSRGYRVLFDFGNVVAHHPENTVFTGKRDADLGVKIYNSAYNLALILAKHSPMRLRAARLLFLLLIGSVATPGLAGAVAALCRHGRPFREMSILWHTWRSTLAGWAAGAALRRRRDDSLPSAEPPLPVWAGHSQTLAARQGGA